LGAKMPAPMPPDEWHGWCERHRVVLTTIIKDLIRGGEIRKTRDPFEPIRSIIVNNQHPMDVLFRLADDYEAERPSAGSLAATRALHYQYLLLIKFATLIPLRGHNFATMTYKADNTGNLYQKPDGSWWLRFEARDFKNYAGAARDDNFDVPIHEMLWPYIEEFLSVHRRHLRGAAECDYLLRPGRGHNRKDLKEPISVGLLSKNMLRITRQYIQNCPGFSMHAFRHLAATEYIKNNPAGFAVAAAVLHEKEETVRINYAWVVPADKFVFWNRYVGALMKDLKELRLAA